MADIAAAHDDITAADTHSVIEVSCGGHFFERNNAVGLSTQTITDGAGVVVEDTGTDADRTRGATEAVIKKSTANCCGVCIGRHLAERDGAV